ncbi:MAG: hypothetical protein JWM93_78 [Frankiales bacterium]|nr:hypothetical protein [Frankiales bacterium]
MAVEDVLFIPGQVSDDYQPHRLHGSDRVWKQTNCYVDLWVEILNIVGLDPVAATGFALGSDFEGSQWTFLKPPPEDLRFLFGIDVAELNVWRPVREHVVEMLDCGALLTVEVDAHYLPDTLGDTYHDEHAKTTIVPLSIDVQNRRLAYLHNAGSFVLDGDDFDGVLPSTGPGDAGYLAPYVERIRLQDLLRDEGVAIRARKLATKHLRRRPATNPIRRMGDALTGVAGITGGDIDAFHRYMFGTCRQCGSAAELAADHAEWLEAHGVCVTAAAAPLLRDVASGAKSLQFALARAVRGRHVDISATIDRMAVAYDDAMAIFVAALGD